MKSATIIALHLVLMLSGCGSTATIEKSWVDEDIHNRSLQGLLVVAIASTEEGRRAFEREFSSELVMQGVHAVPSYTLKGGTDIDKEDVAAMAATAELDTAMIILFAGRDESAVLHPGRRYYAYTPVYGHDYYGRGRVYGVPYQVGQTSDFWAEHKSVHLEASLFQVETEELLWRASSGIEESDDVQSMRSAFIASFVQDLAQQGLVD